MLQSPSEQNTSTCLPVTSLSSHFSLKHLSLSPLLLLLLLLLLPPTHSLFTYPLTLLCSPDWPRTHNPHTLVWVMRPQVCATLGSCILFLYFCIGGGIHYEKQRNREHKGERDMLWTSIKRDRPWHLHKSCIQITSFKMILWYYVYLPVCLCTTYVPGMHGDQKSINPLEMELQMVVSHGVCAENQTPVLWNSSQCVLRPLNHLSNPKTKIWDLQRGETIWIYFIY